MPTTRELTAIRTSKESDDQLRALDPDVFECVLHEYHSPLPWIHEAHHVVPLSWTKALGIAESRTIPTCPTGHDALHSAIRATLKGRDTFRQVDEKVQPFLREALDFWEAHADELRAVRAVLSELTDDDE